MSRPHKRRLALWIGVAGILLIGAAAFWYRDSLRQRWLGYQARKELADESFRPDVTPLSTGKLLEEGPDGFGELARLLRDPDYRVWTNAVWVLDQSFEHDSARETFLDHLRRRDPLALVKYLLIEPYSDGSTWREDGTRNLTSAGRLGDTHSAELAREYWAGDQDAIAPSDARVVRFLTSILDGERDFPVDRDYYHRYRMRSLSALGCMLPKDATSIDPEHPAVEALVRVVESSKDVELRLFAVERLLSSLTRTSSPFYTSFEFWDQLSRSTAFRAVFFDSYTGSVDDRPSSPSLGDPAPVLPLLYVDDPGVFMTVVRLWIARVAPGRPALEAAFAIDVPGLPLEPYRPAFLAKRAREYLLESKDPGVRAAAVYALIALEGGGDRAAALKAFETALESETDETARTTLQAALSSLGREEYRPLAMKGLEAVLTKSRGSSVAQLENELTLLEGPFTPFTFPRDSIEPETTSASWPMIDSPVGGYVRRWSRVSGTAPRQVSVGPQDVIDILVRDGRQETILELADLLYSEEFGSFSFVAYASSVERETPLSKYLPRSAPSRIVVGETTARRDAGDVAEQLRKELLAWWEANHEKLVWDAENVRWTLK